MFLNGKGKKRASIYKSSLLSLFALLKSFVFVFFHHFVLAISKPFLAIFSSSCLFKPFKIVQEFWRSPNLGICEWVLNATTPLKDLFMAVHEIFQGFSQTYCFSNKGRIGFFNDNST